MKKISQNETENYNNNDVCIARQYNFFDDMIYPLQK